MNTFVQSAMDNRSRRVLTENGAETFNTTSRATVDLFFAIGALRGQPVTRLESLFESAYFEDRERALRIALWARDIRGGAGEREIFRNILRFLEKNQPDELMDIIPHIPTFGRWDDLLIFTTEVAKAQAFAVIAKALNEGNGLAAKWMPRKGRLAEELASYMFKTPRNFRKFVVGLTNVVETKMCAKEWEAINLEHVPSLAMTRYTKAFRKHLPDRFTGFVQAVEKGEAKVNTGAIYPYDIVSRISTGYGYEKVERDQWNNQWNALPDFTKGQKALAIVDVSGSMTSTIPGTKNLRPIDVSVSLGLYLADKQKGPFNGLVLTFHANPQFIKVSGKIDNKIKQVLSSDWGMNTNIEAAFRKILDVAKQGNVKPEDMPDSLIILSDMEFDSCTSGTAFETIQKLYNASGYELPRVVFWNIQSRRENNPVKFNQKGVALVSGFSPAIFKNVLSGEFMTPEQMMLEVIMNDRYNIWE